MLFLKRNMYPNELRVCDVSGLHIGYLDYFYEDDEDGMVIKFETYQRIKRRKKRDSFDYSRLNEISNRIDYEEALRRYEEEILGEDILDREVYKG